MNANLYTRQGARGFTLIEIMVALAISVIVMMALIEVFSSQQKTYAQQSQLASTQANARNALYQISRDVRMAGYTGVPLGMDKLVVSGISGGDTFAPIVSVSNGATVHSMTHVASLTSQFNSDTNSDAIEIRGNFNRRTTTLAAPAAALTDNSLQLSEDVGFSGTDFNRPGWVVLGRTGQTINAEMIVSEGGSGDGLTVNLKNVVGSDYPALETIVSPIFARFYWLDESANQIMVANYDPRTGTLLDPLALAMEVTDFEISYNLWEGVANEITEGKDMICDPCQVRSVNISLETIMEKYRPEDPLTREFSVLVKVRNIGFGVTQCNMYAACSY